MKVISLIPFALFASTCAKTVGDALRGTGIVINTCAKNGTAALSFDDGLTEHATIIGRTLKLHGAVGTFFVCGNLYHCLYEFSDSLRELYWSGHQIASHTWSHPDLTQLNDTAINTEMEKVDTVIQNVLGVRPAFMRPPYGAVNANVSAVAAARGQDVVIWNLDSQDWTGANSSTIEGRYDDFVGTKPPSAIVLGHETTTFDVLPYAINLLQSHGYKLVTVAECMGKKPYQQKQYPPVFNPESLTCS